jgi:hypothetical protein
VHFGSLQTRPVPRFNFTRAVLPLQRAPHTPHEDRMSLRINEAIDNIPKMLEERTWDSIFCPAEPCTRCVATLRPPPQPLPVFETARAKESCSLSLLLWCLPKPPMSTFKVGPRDSISATFPICQRGEALLTNRAREHSQVSAIAGAVTCSCYRRTVCMDRLHFITFTTSQATHVPTMRLIRHVSGTLIKA